MEPTGSVPTGPLRLNLGCGAVRHPGFLGVDLRAGPEVDEVADLRGAWPWADSSVTEVIAEDFIEHLPDKVHTLRELYRVLAPNGIARVQVPDAGIGQAAFGDPTHVSYWTLESFHSMYMTDGPFHPGGYRFAVEAQRTIPVRLEVGSQFSERYWVLAALRAMKEA